MLIALSVFLAMAGERSLLTLKQILPASWTSPGSDAMTMSLNRYGVDKFLRLILFSSPERRMLFLFLIVFYAAACAVLLRNVLKGSLMESQPAWSWTDLIWVSVGVVVLWEMIPIQESVQTGKLLLKDSAVVLWIVALAFARGLSLRHLGLNVRRLPGDFTRGAVSAMLLTPSLAAMIFLYCVTQEYYVIPADLQVVIPPSYGSAWLSVLFLPLFEEILFRGFFYRLLRARWPEWAANLATSLIFALIHGDIGLVGAGRFLGSLLMCKLYERTGTVFGGLGAHATFNAMILLVPPLT